MRYAERTKIIKIIKGVSASDGDGVRLTQIIGSPEHLHRGVETVTYMIARSMRHKDNAEHEGVITAGGVQWMTAGRGILHSEMPEQVDGLLHGFQLWVNLPASDKMVAPA